jgi:PST family polysaccharide transporter
VRFKSYFLKGFSLVLGLTLPVTIACGLFADDIVYVVLASAWDDAAAIVRLLAPTITVFAIINPLGWVVFSVGFIKRGMKAAPVIATLMIIGYFISLPYGPKGVAFAYSTVLTLWIIPHIFWCVHRTPISFLDVLKVISGPLSCGIVAGGIAFSVRLALGGTVSALPRLLLESSVLFGAFFTVLLSTAGQKSLYLEAFNALRGSSSTAGRISVSA